MPYASAREGRRGHALGWLWARLVAGAAAARTWSLDSSPPACPAWLSAKRPGGAKRTGSKGQPTHRPAQRLPVDVVGLLHLSSAKLKRLGGVDSGAVPRSGGWLGLGLGLGLGLALGFRLELGLVLGFRLGLG